MREEDDALAPDGNQLEDTMPVLEEPDDPAPHTANGWE